MSLKTGCYEISPSSNDFLQLLTSGFGSTSSLRRFFDVVVGGVSGSWYDAKDVDADDDDDRLTILVGVDDADGSWFSSQTSRCEKTCSPFAVGGSRASLSSGKKLKSSSSSSSNKAFDSNFRR